MKNSTKRAILLTILMIVCSVLLLITAGCGSDTAAPHTATGYAVGVGAILYTEDGAAWKSPDDTTFLMGKTFNDVSAVDSQCAWAVGSTKLGGVLYRTLDGGRSWIRLPAPGGSLPTMSQGVKAVSRDMAWVVGAINTIALTRDGGVTWLEFNGKFDDQHPITFTAVAALDDRRAWAVGYYDPNSPAGAFTTDGGATWTLMDLSAMTKDHKLLDVSAVNANTVWIGQEAPSSGVYLSTDGGKSFSAAYPDTGAMGDCFAILGLSEFTALAGFENSSYEMTFNGGRNWSTQPIDGRLNVSGLTIVGNGIWAGGMYPDGDVHAGEGAILYSGNGGITWTRQTPTGFPGLTRISFVGGRK
jgi:photosystem II stability/assembly factor-like uncharacterized protein